MALRPDDPLLALEGKLARVRRGLWRQSFTRLSGPLLATALVGLAAYLARHQFEARPLQEVAGFAATMIAFALGLAAVLVQCAAPTRRDAARVLERSRGGDRVLTYLDLKEQIDGNSPQQALFLADLQREVATLTVPESRPTGRFAVRVLLPLIAVDALLAAMPPQPAAVDPGLALLREKISLEASSRDPALQSARDALLQAPNPEALSARARKLWEETSVKTRSPNPKAESGDDEDPSALGNALASGREAEARRRAEAIEEAARARGEDAKSLADRIAAAARKAAAASRDQLNQMAATLRKTKGDAGAKGGFGLGPIAAQQARRKAGELASSERVQNLLIKVFNELGEQTPDDRRRSSSEDSDRDALERERDLRRRPGIDDLPSSLREAGQKFLELRRARKS